MIRSDLVTPSQPQPLRLRFSVDDYYKMIELGMIEDYEKAEIIDGELIKKMTIGDRHAFVIDLLMRFFVKSVSDRIRVRVQNPLRLTDYDEPQPDLVLADLTKYDGKRHPRPAETLLVVEVSGTTLKYDRDVKLPLYAAAAIPEVWIVNLRNNVIEVHKNPDIGIYQQAKIYKTGDRIESSVLPDLSLDVASVLS